ncbi:MAG: hypothetical protein A2167_07995 [Planctomycetes bacterium RBG_13_46_10]|nr:MAG: hypothetical protein A2167_07995 [Planctomycetes bacterium RBG_13_46_10]
MKNELFPNYKTIHRLILVMVALVVGLTIGLASVPVFAADEKIINKEKGNPVPENIGFMKNPPKELTEKFPMCDAFLNVEWINKEKKIGYSNYEVIIKGKKRMMWELVTLEGDRLFLGWDVYQYKRQGQLQEIFEMVKNGKVEGTRLVMILTYKGKSIEIHLRTPNDDDSLADHRCTVCVPYPDKKRVWIAEGKSIKQNYSAAQQKELFDRIEKAVGKPINLNDPVQKEWFESLYILDVNFDGKEDIVFKKSFFVTSHNMLYNVEHVYKYEDEYQFTFPPTGRTCHVKSRFFPLTTDGKNYYIDNQCNLTALTSKAEKE